MNPEHKEIIDFINLELTKAKNIRPSIDQDCRSDIFWKLTGKIEILINMREMIESKYLTGAQQSRAVRLDVGKYKHNPLMPVPQNDFEFEDIFGDF